MFHVQQVKWVGCALLVAPAVGLATPNLQDKYPLCNDYYTPGAGLCGAAPVLPVSTALVLTPSLLPPPAPPKDPVDQYLENYGKPPREFVAFYISPTAQNALAWAKKYQDMMEQNRKINMLWAAAEQSKSRIAPASAPSLPLLAPQATRTSPEVVLDLNSATPTGSLFAFSDQIDLTYFFSANCPYCAQMTPELARLASESNGKLSLTCVDVTPVTPQSGPKPANIMGKLPCAWRLPLADELETTKVVQTPTLVVKKGGKGARTFSGLVPLADLKGYIEGK